MTSAALQQSDISSTLPTVFPEDVLKNPDVFVLTITPLGIVEFISDNIHEILGYTSVCIV